MADMTNGSATAQSEPNMVAVVAGFGIGLFWLAMALWCIYFGIKGYTQDRTDYGLVWTVIGVFLLGGGGSALIGTWWHQYSLKRGKHAHH